ncbi:peroxiredoxin [Sphingomonas sp. 3-13AW]|jgi:peroxiredoxin Q/BCP|uniref:peroxiredoxin n=1 Tax=Sphingomonas sp. 3-13AW TaxID=3050450 RepID=UPI003BB680C3
MNQGDAIPAVTLTGSDGTRFDLSTVRPAVVYFYPKADTTGCTREAIDFGDLAPQFRELGVEVIGVSKDPPAKLERFIAKHDLAVRLASDDGTACEAFGVWGEKKLYGRVYMGIERATFLFDADGRLVQAWRNVKVPGHAEAVLTAARALKTAG